MTSIKQDEVDKIRLELYKSFQILSDLNLFQASKWCAEALNGLIEINSPINYPPLQLTPQEMMDQTKFILAKSYFNCKEFDRAAGVLKGCKSGNALFLRLYAILLSVDKTSTEETDGSINVGSFGENNEFIGQKDTVDYHFNSNPNHSDPSSNMNPSKELLNNLNSRLSKIIQESDQYLSNEGSNPFLYYLNGVIYNRKKKYQLSQINLYNSLILFPYNWSCWQELIVSFTTFDEAITFINKVKLDKSSELSSNIMFQFFEVVILQEFYQQSTTLFENLSNLLSIFPKFNFLKVQQFLIYYHNLDYYQAEAIFDQILFDDPLRLDDLDTFSNMLYVMEKKSKLSYLAQFASRIDKFRPETCCIIANYHSMKGEHEKSIMYYKRALILNKNCLSAWTLMGHEFVELKNSHAAIESYRRAVDINAKDFRAWYGLGQAYEVLDMNLYALYYYQKATILQPLDKRMWQAIGNCYEKIDKFEEAIKSFEKALNIDTLTNEDTGESLITFEPHICYRLALIYEKLGNLSDTFKYMKLCSDQEFEWGSSDEISKSKLWLARFALDNNKPDEAHELCKDLNYYGPDLDEARSILRESRSRMSKK
ncbi:anaphase promoting complex subunit 8 [Scheffersomyces coipomensis]|uniref:anaphase promoting complex subunit 8 n=1 Tax=Scheffersomyces coipomensis TaxID=1788519 RepID=UPI00315DA1D2